MQVYLITNLLTQKRYVGKTHKTTRLRWLRHLADSRNDVGCKALQRAILKHGPQSFSIQQIAQFDDALITANAEKLFISILKTKVPNGYNITDGGDGGAGKRSEETKQRISVAMKKNNPCPNGHTRFRVNIRGHRVCLDCHKDKENARYAKHKN